MKESIGLWANYATISGAEGLVYVEIAEGDDDDTVIEKAWKAASYVVADLIGVDVPLNRCDDGAFLGRPTNSVFVEEVRGMYFIGKVDAEYYEKIDQIANSRPLVKFTGRPLYAGETMTLGELSAELAVARAEADDKGLVIMKCVGANGGGVRDALKVLVEECPDAFIREWLPEVNAK